MDLRYRLAVVTGGGGGLGRELAVGLARVGASVLVVDRDLGAAEETVDLLRDHRVAAWAWQADVTVEADLVDVAARGRDLGGVDLLVNNAGAWSSGAQFPDALPDDWRRTLDLDLVAPMRRIQLFLTDLSGRRGRRDGSAAVVNVASSAALGGEPYGSPEYAAAKAGLVRLTTAVAGRAAELGARVTCVVPGWIALERALAEVAALPDDQRAALPALVPPALVTREVLRLLAHGTPGEVVELLEGPPG